MRRCAGIYWRIRIPQLGPLQPPLDAKLLRLCLTLCDPMDCSLPPLSIGLSQQEYWSGLLFPFPGDLPDPGIEPMSFMSPALAGGFFTTSTTWGAHSPNHTSQVPPRLQRHCNITVSLAMCSPCQLSRSRCSKADEFSKMLKPGLPRQSRS